MVEAVVSGVVLAAILGAWATLRRRAKLRLQTRAPVDAVVDRIVREPWAVALDGELPDGTGLLSGKSHLATKEVHDWLLVQGGMDHRETRLRLVVTSKSEKTVVIRDIAVMTERDVPLDGTHVFCPTAGANAATLLVFDLDEDDPCAWEWREDGARQRVGVRPYFDEHSINLESGEAHTFVLLCTTRCYSCRWRLALDIVVGKAQRRVTLDDNGRPFGTSGDPAHGFLRRYHWAWYEGGVFKPMP